MMRQRIGRVLAVVLLLSATIVIVAGNGISDTPSWRALVSWAAFVLLAITIIAALIGRGPAAVWRAPAIVIGSYCVVCLALALFLLGSPLGLDADFILASPADSAKTLVRMVGWPVTLLLVALVAGIMIAFAAALTTLARPVHARTRGRALWALVVLSPVVILTGLPHVHLRTPQGERGGEQIRPAIAPQPQYHIVRGESVFLLQLESVNGLLAGDAYIVGGKPVEMDPLTGMRQLAKKGMFFPHFWGNTVTTHRAQETILCGVVRNVHAPYFDQLIPWDGRCLPALLRDAGYRTVFLSSFQDSEFGSTGQFMKRAGFTDIHFADFMKPGDPLTRWGYEENAFYTRAFEYLRAHYKPRERLFVYFAVCAHHYGFTRDAKTDFNFLAVEHPQRIRQYLWSQRKQDLSLLTFDRLLHDFSGGNAHAFYVPDHSIPLGLYGGSAPSMGATIDNFVIPFLYVPPESRAAEFVVGRTIDEMFAQTDLVSTVAELLGDRNYPNSFVPFMKRNPTGPFTYEQCHVLTQPYTGRWLLIARGENAYQYHVSMETLREFRILRNPLRQVLVKEVPGVTYSEFERRYGCARYRDGVQIGAPGVY